MTRTLGAVYIHTQYHLHKGKLYTAVPLFVMEFAYSTELQFKKINVYIEWIKRNRRMSYIADIKERLKRLKFLRDSLSFL